MVPKSKKDPEIHFIGEYIPIFFVCLARVAMLECICVRD